MVIDPRMKRMLVASDGSPFGAGAIRVGIAMAKQAGAELNAMTMVLTNPEYEAMAPELVQKAENEAVQHLEEIAATAAAEGVSCQPVLCHGSNPVEEIVNNARELGVGMVIMGRRGKRGLARLMVGDATVKVIARAPCSVAVVPKAAEMWSKRILLCTDGSLHSEAARAATLTIAACCRAPVTVLTALVPRHSPERSEEGRRSMLRMTDELKRAGLEAEGHAIIGDAGPVIIDTAQRIGADLIVIGGFGRTGFGRALIGRNAEHVVGHATCVVVVAKPEPAA